MKSFITNPVIHSHSANIVKKYFCIHDVLLAGHLVHYELMYLIDVLDIRFTNANSIINRQ